MGSIRLWEFEALSHICEMQVHGHDITVNVEVRQDYLTIGNLSRSFYKWDSTMKGSACMSPSEMNSFSYNLLLSVN